MKSEEIRIKINPNKARKGAFRTLAGHYIEKGKEENS